MIPVKYSNLNPTEENRHVLVGHSPRTRHVRRMIEKMGRSKWPALLLGETGTGKEVVARAIHAQTKALNAQEPFVTIDCSSLVGPLMESELFGHVKGAFTGAANTKIGLIEAANGGTAFFDEIGELPLDLQAKLLRVLQEKEFRPVGSLGTRRSDFRIIAATNRDLAKEVEKGTFRRDLYFRLNVINIRLAPLRERKEDIPALINHFLSRVAGNYSLTAETLVLAPFAVGYLLWQHRSGAGALGRVDLATNLLILSAGVITAVPLTLFAYAARRIRLSTLGLLQYIAPSVQLVLGIWLYQEPFDRSRVLSFTFIWIALALYSVDNLIQQRAANPNPNQR